MNKMPLSSIGASENGRVRDAIVISGWNWESFNVPERIALAFAHLGARVLYCENPVSMFRHNARARQEIDRGVHRTGLAFFGHRLNRFPILLPQIQSKLLATQIMRHVADLELRNPLFVYPHGEFFASLASEFKRRKFSLVHVCMDYPELHQEKCIGLSDITLVIPKTVFHELSAKYGAKIALIPQVGRASIPANGSGNTKIPDELRSIPRPRLGYVGPAQNRLNRVILDDVLSANPEWQFIHFGPEKCLARPNVHALPWCDQETLKTVISHLDVGLMPYDCSSSKNFHCMPLKLFDYFSVGLPVVSTPIANLLEFSETVYFGSTAEEMCAAIRLALKEPSDSTLKSRRMEIAQQHSIEALANALSEKLRFHLEH